MNHCYLKSNFVLLVATVLALVCSGARAQTGTAGGCLQPRTYCTAKINSVGCMPTISFTGEPSATAGYGFVVSATGVRNNHRGLLFYGTSGKAADVFQNGTLCVNLPIRRTPTVASRGNPPPTDCSGTYSIDMNRFAVGGLGGSPLPALTVAGTIVDCQWWGRDQGFVAPSNTMLSNGLEYTVCQ
jgi:hypothetical protein